ncbi:LexA family protein [Methylobacterium sp. J-070]|uniref:LexA family protein n=1 Tax=Methylobacterium sp. J-070 TaxID=2836650 RepID=UPI003919B57C
MAPSPRIGLTGRQARLLAFIVAEAEAGRPPPSFSEMAAHMGLHSKSGIHRLLTALEERGHVVRLPHRTRALALAGSEPGDAPRLPEPVADRLSAYCRRRRLAVRDVLAAAVASYLERHP